MGEQLTTVLNEFRTMDLTTFTWNNIELEGSAPTTGYNYGASATYHETDGSPRAIQYGGNGPNHETSNFIYGVDLTTNVWSQLAPLSPGPSARQYVLVKIYYAQPSDSFTSNAGDPILVIFGVN